MKDLLGDVPEKEPNLVAEFIKRHEERLHCRPVDLPRGGKMLRKLRLEMDAATLLPLMDAFFDATVCAQVRRGDYGLTWFCVVAQELRIALTSRQPDRRVAENIDNMRRAIERVKR